MLAWEKLLGEDTDEERNDRKDGNVKDVDDEGEDDAGDDVEAVEDASKEVDFIDTRSELELMMLRRK